MSRWKRTLAVSLVAIVAAITAVGCSRVVTRGAIPLGDTGANGKEIWVYIQTNSPRVDGVYRCKDDAQGVSCIKADVIRGNGR